MAAFILARRSTIPLSCHETYAEKLRAALTCREPAIRDFYGIDHGVPVSRHATQEKGHGRQETRTYFVCDVPDDLPDRHRWPKLSAIGLSGAFSQ
jgi:hypothetical protein